MNKFDKVYRSIISESRLATDFDDKRFRYNGNFWVAELERDQTAKGNGFYQAELYLIVWKDEVEWEIRDYYDLLDDGLGLRIDGYGAHSFKYNTLMERNKKIDRLYQKFVDNFNAIDIEQKKKEKKLENLYNNFVQN